MKYVLERKVGYILIRFFLRLLYVYKIKIITHEIELASYIAEKFPSLIAEKDPDGMIALQYLAGNQMAFQGETRTGAGFLEKDSAPKKAESEEDAQLEKVSGLDLEEGFLEYFGVGRKWMERFQEWTLAPLTSSRYVEHFSLYL